MTVWIIVAVLSSDLPPVMRVFNPTAYVDERVCHDMVRGLDQLQCVPFHVMELSYDNIK